MLYHEYIYNAKYKDDILFSDKKVENPDLFGDGSIIIN